MEKARSPRFRGLTADRRRGLRKRVRWRLTLGLTLLVAADVVVIVTGGRELAHQWGWI